MFEVLAISWSFTVIVAKVSRPWKMRRIVGDSKIVVSTVKILIFYILLYQDNCNCILCVFIYSYLENLLYKSPFDYQPIGYLRRWILLNYRVLIWRLLNQCKHLRVPSRRMVHLFQRYLRFILFCYNLIVEGSLLITEFFNDHCPRTVKRNRIAMTYESNE